MDDHEFWGFHDYGVNAMAKFAPVRGVETYLGYDFQAYGGRDDVLIITQKKESDSQAVFGQVRLTPDVLPNTHLAAGVRYNSPWTTAISATVWNLVRPVRLHARRSSCAAPAGTSFRLPDATGVPLFANDPLFNNEIGNPNLKPETASNLNGSLGGEGNGWGWELIGFHRETKNLIDLSGPTPDPDVDTFINLPGKVTASGFEAVGQAAINPSVSLQGSYTHTRTRQSGAATQFDRVPEDLAQATLDLHPEGRHFGGAVVGSYVGSVSDLVGSGFGPVQHGHYGGGRPERLCDLRAGRSSPDQRQPRERSGRDLLHPRQPRVPRCGWGAPSWCIRWACREPCMSATATASGRAGPRVPADGSARPRWLVVTHRYLGVALGALMLVWCLSRRGHALRRPIPASLRPTSGWRACRGSTGPTAAPSTAAGPGRREGPVGAQIEQLADTPVLRLRLLDGPQATRTADAILDPLQRPRSRAPTSMRDRPWSSPRPGATPPASPPSCATSGRWAASSNRGRPFWRVRLGDAGATDIYVSQVSGEAVQRTTRAGRVLNWLGAVPHWLYPTLLRQYPKLWTQVVIWTSLAGVFLTLVGLYLGILSWRPFRDQRLSPFRGLMTWHHLAGLGAGVLTLTWVASGLISMNPWGLPGQARATIRR